MINILNKKTAIIFEQHPHRAGHALLSNQKNLSLVHRYGFSNIVDSREFEKLSILAAKDNIEVYWYGY